MHLSSACSQQRRPPLGTRHCGKTLVSTINPMGSQEGFHGSPQAARIWPASFDTGPQQVRSQSAPTTTDHNLTTKSTEPSLYLRASPDSLIEPGTAGQNTSLSDHNAPYRTKTRPFRVPEWARFSWVRVIFGPTRPTRVERVVRIASRFAITTLCFFAVHQAIGFTATPARS